MKKTIAILFLIISTFTFARKAPDFSLSDQYNVTHTISNYKGKIVFLNFWATWCPPCKKEMPDIEELYKEYGENKKDIIILGVNNEDSEKVKNFLEKNNYSFPTVSTKNNDILREYRISAFPTSYLIGKDGEVEAYAVGSLTKEQIKEAIEELINKK